jgi:hypothetical protein
MPAVGVTTKRDKVDPRELIINCKPQHKQVSPNLKYSFKTDRLSKSLFVILNAPNSPQKLLCKWGACQGRPKQCFFISRIICLINIAVRGSIRSIKLISTCQGDESSQSHVIQASEGMEDAVVFRSMSAHTLEPCITSLHSVSVVRNMLTEWQTSVRYVKKSTSC